MDDVQAALAKVEAEIEALGAKLEKIEADVEASWRLALRGSPCVVHLVPLARALSLPTDSLLRLSTLEAVRLPERARQVCAQVRQKLVVSDTLRTGTYI